MRHTSSSAETISGHWCCQEGHLAKMTPVHQDIFYCIPVYFVGHAFIKMHLTGNQ